MFEFILAPQNYPFTISITVMLIIATLEGVGTLMGAGLSDAIAHLFPEADFSLDAPDLDHPSPMDWVLSFFKVKGVPILALLVVHLLVFGLAGLMLQKIAWALTGTLLSGFIAAILAFVASMPVTKVLAKGLSKVIPQDESSAISSHTLVGRLATITLGQAKPGYPTRAKTTDQHGKTHYFMLEPDAPDMTFNQGEEALLVRYDGAKFYGIHPSLPKLHKKEGQKL